MSKVSISHAAESIRRRQECRRQRGHNPRIDPAPSRPAPIGLPQRLQIFESAPDQRQVELVGALRELHDARPLLIRRPTHLDFELQSRRGSRPARADIDSSFRRVSSCIICVRESIERVRSWAFEQPQSTQVFRRSPDRSPGSGTTCTPAAEASSPSILHNRIVVHEHERVEPSRSSSANSRRFCDFGAQFTRQAAISLGGGSRPGCFSKTTCDVAMLVPARDREQEPRLSSVLRYSETAGSCDRLVGAELDAVEADLPNDTAHSVLSRIEHDHLAGHGARRGSTVSARCRATDKAAAEYGARVDTSLWLQRACSMPSSSIVRPNSESSTPASDRWPCPRRWRGSPVKRAESRCSRNHGGNVPTRSCPLERRSATNDPSASSSCHPVGSILFGIRLEVFRTREDDGDVVCVCAELSGGIEQRLRRSGSYPAKSQSISNPNARPHPHRRNDRLRCEAGRRSRSARRWAPGDSCRSRAAKARVACCGFSGSMSRSSGRHRAAIIGTVRAGRRFPPCVGGMPPDVRARAPVSDEIFHIAQRADSENTLRRRRRSRTDRTAPRRSRSAPVESHSAQVSLRELRPALRPVGAGARRAPARARRYRWQMAYRARSRSGCASLITRRRLAILVPP